LLSPFLWSVGSLGWLGVPAAEVAVTLIEKQRAVFATMIGLIVYLPLAFTESFSGNRFAMLSALLVKSCGLDVDSTDLEAFRSGMSTGMATGLIIQGLLMIFVSKLVSTWISRMQSDETVGSS
jgi:hypothetical protein